MKHKTREVGLSEARTHLSALVARVQRGEEITITKQGVPVARLVRAGVGLRSLIEEGRL